MHFWLVHLSFDKQNNENMINTRDSFLLCALGIGMGNPTGKMTLWKGIMTLWKDIKTWRSLYIGKTVATAYLVHGNLIIIGLERAIKLQILTTLFMGA